MGTENFSKSYKNKKYNYNNLKEIKILSEDQKNKKKEDIKIEKNKDSIIENINLNQKDIENQDENIEKKTIETEESYNIKPTKTTVNIDEKTISNPPLNKERVLKRRIISQ